MTIADTAQPAPKPLSALPARRRGQRLIVGVSIALLLVAGGVTAISYVYDSVPLVESNVAHSRA